MVKTELNIGKRKSKNDKKAKRSYRVYKTGGSKRTKRIK
jgi:hypothetical protein